MRSVKRIEKIVIQVVHIEKKREISLEDAEYLILDATDSRFNVQKKDRKSITAVKRNGYS